MAVIGLISYASGLAQAADRSVPSISSVPAAPPSRSVPDFTPGSAPEPMIASPIRGLRANQLHDSFDEIHNGHPHQAIDIDEPAGTPVRAVASGTVIKLFLSKAGGNTVYEFG